MTPTTPKNKHQRTLSSISTPETPETGYVLASEHLETTPTKRGAILPPDETITTLSHSLPTSLTSDTASSSQSSSHSTGADSVSTNDASYDTDLLEMLENDEGDMSHDEDTEDALSDSGEPLFPSSRRRRRKLFSEDEDKDRSLFGLVPHLLLAHPLPLLPLLPILPSNFLPAGIVFFIPILCGLAILSSCAHIVIVYLAWYLKVPSFEHVFASVTAVITSTLGLLIGWLDTVHPLLSSMTDTLPGALSSRILWTVLPALSMLPSLIPSRATRSLRKAPIFLALLIPVVVFLVIGRTVELDKDNSQDVAKRRLGFGENGSAGAGLATLTVFFSPHLNTLPIHATLSRNKRTSFALPCILSSGILLALSLPFALVPYYLLRSPSDTPTATPTTSSGVFNRLPAGDGWVNLARALQCALTLGTCDMWLLRCRDSFLGCLDMDRGRLLKVSRWTGFGLWSVALIVSCIGGWLVEKIELLGVVSTLAVGWLLPAVFFIITFHVRSPLSIVFPSRDPPLPQHGRSESLSDPSVDVLLARKERQLQKRRLGRRLWQDLIVYIGILPVGCITIAWTLGNLIGIW